MKVVALATGVKCINSTDVCVDGNIVKDSHAEVLTRRAFLRYLYSELEAALCACSSTTCYRRLSSIFERCDSEKLFRVRSGISFHLYSSQAPCGDASVFPINTSRHCYFQFRKRVCKKRKRDGADGGIENDGSKKMKEEEDGSVGSYASTTAEEEHHFGDGSRNENPKGVTDKRDITVVAEDDCIDIIQKNDFEESGENASFDDWHRTGAHVIQGEKERIRCRSEDAMKGALRVKPGRVGKQGEEEERTTSMSCSDKIAKWNALGLQGALLAVMIQPIYLSSITVSDLFCLESLARALWARNAESLAPSLSSPASSSSSSSFFSPSSSPSSSSLSPSSSCSSSSSAIHSTTSPIHLLPRNSTLQQNFGYHYPAILHSSRIFLFGRVERERLLKGDVVTSNTSVLQWLSRDVSKPYTCDDPRSEKLSPERDVLISSRGLKMGAKKAKECYPLYASAVCKRALYKEYLRLKRLLISQQDRAKTNPELGEEYNSGGKEESSRNIIQTTEGSKSYALSKRDARDYFQMRERFLDSPSFRNWTASDSKYEQFDATIE